MDNFVYFNIKTVKARQWFYKYKPTYLYYLDKTFVNILQEWFDETDDLGAVGESDQIVLSFISNLILSNHTIKHIVQLGTYAGLSSLIIGKILEIREDGKLITLDIDKKMLDFTQKYVDKSNLNNYIDCRLESSIDINAINKIENEIDLLFIDSAHIYEQAIKELNLWYPKMRKSGIILLHDAAPEACGGGVNIAIKEYCENNKINYNILVPPVYNNSLGLGIIVKE